MRTLGPYEEEKCHLQIWLQYQIESKMRKKTFTTHLLSSEENQKIIRKANEISKKKKEKQLQRQKNNERNYTK